MSLLLNECASVRVGLHSCAMSMPFLNCFAPERYFSIIWVLLGDLATGYNQCITVIRAHPLGTHMHNTFSVALFFSEW